MNKYILEIGTEELPGEFLSSVQSELTCKIETFLSENYIPYGSVKVYTTPRRITSLIEDIAESQKEQITKIRGPQAKAAFDAEGSPTKAAEGFSSKFNIPVSDLTKETVDGVEYVFAKVQEGGKSSFEIIAEKIEKVIFSVSGKRFMKWGSTDYKFPRPIRWVFSMYNRYLIPLSIAGVQADYQTYGHRQLANKALKVSHADHYLTLLEENYVIVDQDKRRKAIEEQLKHCFNNGYRVSIHEDLLNTVTHLVEWPVALVGTFDEKFLQIPDDVIITVMAHHQKYFPVVTQDDRLINRFITISNVLKDREQTVVEGNQKVIKARLEDAIFFFNEDRKKTLKAYVPELEGVTFLKGLGTLFDKTIRLQKLAISISQQDAFKKNVPEQFVAKAAYLAKADLSTHLVKEITELQGTIGYHYALLDGEEEAIAVSIQEHYLPRFQGDDLPQSNLGIIVSVADKVDNLVGIFSIGKQPTGAADPFAARRSAIGLLNILIEKGSALDLRILLETAYDYFSAFQGLLPKVEVITNLCDFIFQRLKILLEDRGYRYDLVEAFISCSCAEQKIYKATIILDLLTKMVKEDWFGDFYESTNRIKRILKGYSGSAIDSSLLEQEEERHLFNTLTSVSCANKTEEEFLQELRRLVPPVKAFFDNVLVMSEDEKVKINRLNLLASCDEKFTEFADFSKIIF